MTLFKLIITTIIITIAVIIIIIIRRIKIISATIISTISTTVFQNIKKIEKNGIICFHNFLAIICRPSCYMSPTGKKRCYKITTHHK